MENNNDEEEERRKQEEAARKKLEEKRAYGRKVSQRARQRTKDELASLAAKAEFQKARADRLEKQNEELMEKVQVLSADNQRLTQQVQLLTGTSSTTGSLPSSTAVGQQGLASAIARRNSLSNAAAAAAAAAAVGGGGGGFNTGSSRLKSTGLVESGSASSPGGQNRADLASVRARRGSQGHEAGDLSGGSLQNRTAYQQTTGTVAPGGTSASMGGVGTINPMLASNNAARGNLVTSQLLLGAGFPREILPPASTAGALPPTSGAGFRVATALQSTPGVAPNSIIPATTTWQSGSLASTIPSQNLIQQALLAGQQQQQQQQIAGLLHLQQQQRGPGAAAARLPAETDEQDRQLSLLAVLERNKKKNNKTDGGGPSSNATTKRS